MISELLLRFEQDKSCKTFTIKDASVYNTALPVTCGQLTVKVPGFSNCHTFDVAASFSTQVNLSTLGIQDINDPNELYELPDGNYFIRYSINPNDKLFVEYNYYNVCKLYCSYIKILCKFFTNKCDMTVKEQNLEIDRLFEISSLIEYAKIAAEDCGDTDLADNLYNSARDKINKNDC